MTKTRAHLLLFKDSSPTVSAAHALSSRSLPILSLIFDFKIDFKFDVKIDIRFDFKIDLNFKFD